MSKSKTNIKNANLSNAAWRRIIAERESVPSLNELWRAVCADPYDDGPIAMLADCLMESGNSEMIAQGEYFLRIMRGQHVARPRLGHWIAELSKTQVVSQEGLHINGMPAGYSFGTMKWALPWLKVFGLFPVVGLRCLDRLPLLYHRHIAVGNDDIFGGLYCWLRLENDVKKSMRGGTHDISYHTHTVPHAIFRFLGKADAIRSDVRIGYRTSHIALDHLWRACVDYARWMNDFEPLYNKTPEPELTDKQEEEQWTMFDKLEEVSS